MKSYRAEIERLTPQLRQVARALVEAGRSDVADDLVHDAIVDALRWDQGGLAEDVQHRLYARLIGANRLRLRTAVGERRTAPSSNAESRPAQQALGYAGSGEAGAGLDSLSLNDREALLLVVLARLDYAQVAEVLGIPIATLITRLTRARDTLGSSLWSHGATRHGLGAPSGQRPAMASHLRLVKS